MEIKYEKCGQEAGQIKKTAEQKPKAKDICTSTVENIYTRKKERMYPEELKNRAIELYIEGNSGKTVGCLLKIIKDMCLR